MPSEQTNLVYDYMIRNGKKLGYKKRYKADDGVNYMEMSEIKRSLLEMKDGALISFINYLLEKNVFKSESTARAFLSYDKYSRAQHDTRHKVSAHFHDWEYKHGLKFKKISRDEKMAIVTARFKSVWSKISNETSNINSL